MGQITVFAGGFGSGKSELALNYAMSKQAAEHKTVLADLDLVNPYFASREAKDMLESQGIRVVAPRADLSFGDVPSIPGEIIGMLQQDNEMIVDLAGDEVGSLVLGYLKAFMQRKTIFYLVVNPYRPFSQNIESLREVKELMEAAAQREFTAIISNPNLVKETTLDTIRKGHSKVMTFSESLGIPVAYLTVEERFYHDLLNEYGDQLRALLLYLAPNWL